MACPRLPCAQLSNSTLWPLALRALVQERHQDWSERFGPLGLTVTELSGDSDAEARELEAADLICTTPEKFGED
jgi:replicative superfamily II helicase